MNNDHIIEVIEVLKKKSKAENVTYASLAEAVGVSLPTIKRWFSTAKGIDFSHLIALCNALNTTLKEVLIEVDEGISNSVLYTAEQETCLANNLDALVVFDLLVRGSTVKRIQKKLNFTETKMIKLLALLDKISLIKWMPSNKVKILLEGDPAWIANGPLSKRLRKQILDSFIGVHNKEHTRFYLHDYLEVDYWIIQEKLDDLYKTMERASMRAKRKPRYAKSYGLYIAFKAYKWDLEEIVKSI